MISKGIDINPVFLSVKYAVYFVLLNAFILTLNIVLTGNEQCNAKREQAGKQMKK